MKTDDRARYKKIGSRGDKLLKGKTVAIAGLGGMGAAAAEILARENLDLRLVDRGRVEEEDMHRLSLFYEEDITKFKVKQAKARLNAINPTIQVKSFHEELSESTVFLLQGEVVVDTSNNSEINDLIVAYATGKKLPLVLGRYAGGTVRVLVLQKKATPALLSKIHLPTVEKEGVFGPAATFAGSLVASQVLKLLIGEKGSYLIDADVWDAKLKVTKI